MPSYGDNLRILLKMARINAPQGPISLQEMAEAIGRDERTVRRIEDGEVTAVSALVIDSWLRASKARLVMRLEPT